MSSCSSFRFLPLVLLAIGCATPGTRDVTRPPASAQPAQAPPAVTRIESTGEVAAPAPVVAAPLDEIDHFVRDRAAMLRACYEESGLKANPELAGRLTLEVTLEASGRVAAATATERAWTGGEGGEAVERCLVEKVKGWTFPAPGEGGATHEIPLEFRK